MVLIRHIDVPAVDAQVGTFDVRVELEIDGVREWFGVRVEPSLLDEMDARLLVASSELIERFRATPRTLNQIVHLVGKALRPGAVHLPQRVAA